MSKEIIWRQVEGNQNAIEVNLGAEIDPRMMFERSEIIWRFGKQEGWVLLELRGDYLFLDGKTVTTTSSKNLDYRTIKGIADKVLHPNICTALVANQHLMPVMWHRNSNYAPSIQFLGAVGIYHDPNNCFKDCEDYNYYYVLAAIWRGRCWVDQITTVIMDNDYSPSLLAVTA